MKTILIAILAVFSLTAGLAQKPTIGPGQGKHHGRFMKALGLNVKQVEQIKSIRQQAREQIKSVKGSAGDAASKKERAKAIKQHAKAQVLSVLTLEQRAKLDSMRKLHKKAA